MNTDSHTNGISAQGSVQRTSNGPSDLAAHIGSSQATGFAAPHNTSNDRAGKLTDGYACTAPLSRRASVKTHNYILHKYK